MPTKTDTMPASGEVAAAELVAELMRQADELARTIPISCAYLTRLSRAQRGAGDAEGAAFSLAKARSLAVTAPDGYSKEYAFRDVLDVQCEAGDWDGAKETAGAIPDVAVGLSCFVAIATAQTKKGDLGAARQTLAIARDKANAIPPEAKGKKTSVLLAIAKAQAASGDIGGALRTADDIAIEYGRNTALGVVIEAQLKTHDFAGAKQTADRVAGVPYQVSMLRRIGVSESKAGQQEAAVDTLRTARQRAQTVPKRKMALGEIVKTQIRIRDLAGARETADAIPDDSLKAVCLCAVVEAYADTGAFAEARAVLDTMPAGGTKARALAHLLCSLTSLTSLSHRNERGGLGG